MIYKNYRLILLWLLVFLFINFACKLPVLTENIIPQTTPSSRVAVQSVQQNLEQALQAAQNTGQFFISLDEQQLTTLIASEIQSFDQPKASDVKILLRDNQIQIYFNLIQTGITVPAEVMLSAQADLSGKLSVTVISAKVGPIPFPDDMKNMISNQIEKTITDQIKANNGNVHFDTIVIGNGQMSIQAHLQ